MYTTYLDHFYPEYYCLSFFSSSSSLVDFLLLSWLIILPFLQSIQEKTRDTFRVWLISLNAMMIFSSIYFFVNDVILFFFVSKLVLHCVCVCHYPFFHQLRHLGCFRSLAIVNSIPVNEYTVISIIY